MLKAKVELLESSNQNSKIKSIDLENNVAFIKLDAKFLKMQSDTEKCLENSKILTKNFFAIIEKVDIVERALKLKQNDNCALQDVVNEKCLLENESLLRLKRESNVVDIECEQVEWTKPDGTFQSCNVKNLKITNREVVINNAVVGYRKETIDGRNIEELKVFNEQTVFLPLNLAKSFPNLKTLSFVECGLVAVNTRSLSGLIKLQTLTLSRNAIMKVSTEGFTNLDALSNLDLSHNQIDRVNDETLKALMELVIVKLDNNRLTELTANAFASQQKLKFLFLQNNKLASISPNILESSRKLEFADFSKNDCVNLAASKESKITIKNLKTYFAENCSV